MTRINERKLETLLTGPPAPEPPPELRDRLVDEIPDEIVLHPGLGRRRVVRVPTRHPWRLAAAAMLTVALTGAVTWQLRQRSGPMAESLSGLAERAARPADAARPERDAVATTATASAPRERSLRESPSAAAQVARERAADGGGAAAAHPGADLPVPAPDRATEVRGSASSPMPAPSEAGTAGRPRALTLGLADSAPSATERPRLFARNEPDEPAPNVAGRHSGAAVAPETAAPPLGSAFRADQAAVVQAKAEEETTQVAAPRNDQEVARPGPLATAVRGGVTAAGLARDETKRQRPLAGADADALRTAPAAEGFEIVDGLDLRLPPASVGAAAADDDARGDMYFAGSGVNPFVDTSNDRFSTFALEVDTASATVVRRYLEDGRLPPPEAVRVEEMVNAFKYFEVPGESAGVQLQTAGAPSPYAENERSRVLVFGVGFPTVGRAARPPAVLTFVVDTSGSMARENRLGVVQRALASLLVNLEEHDRVGLVSFGSRGQVLVAPTTDHALVRRALDRLAPSGSTNAEEGLVLGYRLADEHFSAGGINRVVLCSDGVANVGRTGPEAILERIRAEARRGIELTAVGVGMGNYNDALLERLADAGDGRYAYVDTFDEARRLFVEQLTGTLFTVAHDAKAQVEFDAATVSRWRLLGYENRDVADERFRDPTVDGGEIGAGHTAVAVYEVELADGADRRAPVATLRVRYRPTGADEEVEVRSVLATGDLARSWSRAQPSLRLAATVAELGELLRRSSWARSGSFGAVAGELDRLARELDDPRVAETAELARTAARLAGEGEWPAAERDLP